MTAISRALVVLVVSLLSDDATTQAPVRAETVSDSSIVRQVHVNGTVTSPRCALLSTAVASIVSQRMTEVGEWVHPGNGLLELVAIDPDSGYRH